MSKYVRLPHNYTPEKYNIDLYIDVLNLEYIINYDIDLICKLPEKYLILNSIPKYYTIEEIQIKKWDLISDSYQKLGKCDYLYGTDTNLSNLINKFRSNEDYTEYKINFKYFIEKLENDPLFKPIEESVYISLPEFKEEDKLRVSFKIKGNIGIDRNVGFYYSIFGNDKILLKNDINLFLEHWKDETKNENMIKNSVFTCISEPVEFRTIFPCFDEPCFKSKFNLSVSIDKRYYDNSLKILSNGDLIDIIPIDNIIIYKFSESPLMSIYLLTWTLGYYQYIETFSDKIRIRVYTPIIDQGEGSFALDISKRSLDFYQDYFKIPYSFHKLDLVPVPVSNWRALECWGCVVFINYALLVDKLLDIKERKNIARTISHEISHMWFGNLVTMDWWDDIWLNEGFARYMEFVCLSEIKPEFEIWYKYIELIYEVGMRVDEDSSTHPVAGKCPSPSKLKDIFDTISYAKGSSVIRMLAFYLGKEVFRSVIVEYLEKYQYGCTKTDYLWNIFNDKTGKDIKGIMNNWLFISGHPIVYAELVIINENYYLKLKQEPFPSDYNQGNKSLWKIPIFIKTKKGNHVYLMEDYEYMISLEAMEINYDDYIKINYDMQGFYRVKYSDDMLKRLLVDYKYLSNLDLIGLITDYNAFKDYYNCLIILNSIKPINDYITLSYAYKIYSIIKEKTFVFKCFNEILPIEYNSLTKITDKVNLFFYDLIDHEMEFDKIYLNDSSHYLDEMKDEYYDLIIKFKCLIGSEETLISYIIKNFNDNHIRVHKNFKYTIYQIICSNTFKYFNIEKEREIYSMILNEYKQNFFKLSLQERQSFRSSLLDFENSSEDIVYYFIDHYKSDKQMQNTFFKNIDFYRLFPNNRFKFLRCLNKYIIQNYKMNNESKNLKEYLSHDRIIFGQLSNLFNHIKYEFLQIKLFEYMINELSNLCSETFEMEYLKRFLNVIIYDDNQSKQLDDITVKILNYFNKD